MAGKEADKAEEPGFRVTDRRREGREESPERSRQTAASREPEPSGAAGPPPAEAEDADIHAVPVEDLVRLFIAELHTRAWIHLGLTVHPVTHLVVKDLPQARLAIDCLAALVERLGTSVTTAERDEMERLLADLRINFVRQSAV